MEVYPWYTEVSRNEPLYQGDFFHSCPVVIPPSTVQHGQENVDIQVLFYDLVVVMSQSCDLAEEKIDIVLVCPVWQFPEFKQKNSFFGSKEGKKALKRGGAVGYHLLNPCHIQGFERPHLVVDFRNVYGVALEFLQELAVHTESRVRLLPPYREHLSQAFARFFMRVGLPVDIEPFD